METKPRKFSAALIGAAVTVIIAWVVELYAGKPELMSVEVTAAFQGLFTYIASALIPDAVEE